MVNAQAGCYETTNCGRLHFSEMRWSKDFPEALRITNKSWWTRRVATVDFRPFPNKGAAFKGPSGACIFY